MRGRGRTVGVISVDPSSPFTQGALLGDRIRLADHFLDPDVFIRSMGTRGHLGGLAETTLQAALLLDAAGKDLVFVETVGTGQSEVEITGIADTVVLALMPGSGDSIQALKAGIMEIPDVIVVNKRDHPAAKTMLNEVRSILGIGAERDWKPPIVLTEAVRGEGVEELWNAVEEHRAHLEDTGLLAERRAANLAGEVFAVATARASAHLREAVSGDPELARLLDEVKARKLDPLTAVQEIMVRVFKVDVTARPSRTSKRPGSGSAASRARRRSTPRARSGDLAGRPVVAQGGEPPAHGVVQDPRRRQPRSRRSTRRSARRGVVAASAGNHAQAVAWAAREAGIKATIFVPEDAPMAKVDATRGYGAEVVMSGTGYDEAYEASARASRGGRHVRPSVRGSGRHRRPGNARARARGPARRTTWTRSSSRSAAAASPSGIAIALRARRPGMRIVGVQSEAFAPLVRGGRVGGFTIADGIAVKRPGELTESILRDVLDEIVTVTDDEIAAAVVLLLERVKLVVEGAGAASVAALLAGRAGGEGRVVRGPLRREHRREHARSRWPATP